MQVKYIEIYAVKVFHTIPYRQIIQLQLKIQFCSMDSFVLFGFVYFLVIPRIPDSIFSSFFFLPIFWWKNEEAIERA